jgi:large subunit ribosomal protein L25
MAVIPLRGTRREKLGKGGARKARAAGEIPGVLYGHGETPVAVAVGSREFDVALRGHKGGNAIVSLSVAGSDYTALVRDVQYDPVTHQIIHLDFQHISLTEMIEVSVPIHLTGLAVGVKDGGGILEPITRELEVRCLPTAIPASIDVDVSALNIGDSIHVRDITVPEGVVVLADPETTLATVVPPTVMEEKPAEEVAAAATVEGAEPEVIAKGKKTEEEEAEAKVGEKAAEKEKDKGKK